MSTLAGQFRGGCQDTLRQETDSPVVHHPHGHAVTREDQVMENKA